MTRSVLLVTLALLAGCSTQTEAAKPAPEPEPTYDTSVTCGKFVAAVKGDLKTINADTWMTGVYLKLVKADGLNVTAADARLKIQELRAETLPLCEALLSESAADAAEDVYRHEPRRYWPS